MLTTEAKGAILKVRKNKKLKHEMERLYYENN